MQADYRKQIASLDSKLDTLIQVLASKRSAPQPNISRAALLAKIDELKIRRRQLIDRYPTHTDIPVLAKQIQELTSRMNSPSGSTSGNISDLARQMNETRLRHDYFAKLLRKADQMRQDLKPAWAILAPVEAPGWPRRVDGWPIGAGVTLGSLVLGLFLFKKRDAASDARAD